MTVFLLSLGGFPPTAGFIGKWYIFNAAVQEGYYWLAIIGVLTSVVSVFFYLRIVVMMYMTEGPEIAPAARSRHRGRRPRARDDRGVLPGRAADPDPAAGARFDLDDLLAAPVDSGLPPSGGSQRAVAASALKADATGGSSEASGHGRARGRS